MKNTTTTPKNDPHKKEPSEIPDKSCTEQEPPQTQELTDTLQRLQAEFDNYRKRLDREITEKKQQAKAEVLQKILPVLDSFEHAIKNHPETHEGLQRIYAQLLNTLEQEGLKPIPHQGKFNPYQHEVLLVEKSEKEEGTILEELQRGYTYQGKTLRTSKVKISQK